MENNNQTITIDLKKTHTAIAIALIIISCIIGVYIIKYATTPPGYHTIYLLDSQNKAENYPETIIINQNNTFNTQIVVTNNMRTWQEYQVQVKIVHHTIYFPVDAPTYSTYEFTLDVDKSWNNQIPITITEEGTYSVVFELYTKKDDTYIFTGNPCVLHIDAITDKLT